MTAGAVTALSFRILKQIGVVEKTRCIARFSCDSMTVVNITNSLSSLLLMRPRRGRMNNPQAFHWCGAEVAGVQNIFSSSTIMQIS